MSITMIIFTECSLEDLINLSQAARILEVSRPTIYKLVRVGDLRVVARLSGLPYMDKREVDELKRRRNNVL